MTSSGPTEPAAAPGRAEVHAAFRELYTADELYELARETVADPGFVPDAPTHLREVVPGDEDLRVVTGDLVVDGPVDLYDDKALVVLGDLTAANVFVDETARLVVTGTTRARVVHSDGDVWSGRVEAVLALGTEGSFQTTGDVIAKIAISEEGALGANDGEIRADLVLDEDAGWDEWRDLARRLPAKLVDDDADPEEDVPSALVDVWKLAKYVAKGNDVDLG